MTTEEKTIESEPITGCTLVELNRLLKRTEAFQPEELPAPGGPQQWVMLRLAEQGVKFQFDGNKVVDMTGPVDAIINVNRQMNDIYYAGAEHFADDFKKYVDGESTATPWRGDVQKTIFDDGNKPVDTAEAGDASSLVVRGESAEPVAPGAGAVESGETVEAGAHTDSAECATDVDIEQLIPPELKKWWQAQDPEYQRFFASQMTMEEKWEELTSAKAMLESNTASAVVELDAGSVSELPSGSTGEYLEERRNELVKTVEGYIVDADGVVINDETVFELLGLRPDFQINSNDDINVAAGKINDLQSRINRRCGMFLRKTMPLFAAHQRAMQWYYGQLHRYGEDNLPRWDKDSREGVKNPHKAGDFKKKSLKLDEGVVYYRSKGGYKVESEAAIKAKILREMRVIDINALLPESIREKYGARLDLSFSRKKIYALAEKGEVFEGLKFEPVDEIGKIGIGDENSKSMWTPDALCSLVRSVMKKVLCTFKEIEYKPDTDYEEGEE